MLRYPIYFTKINAFEKNNGKKCFKSSFNCTNFDIYYMYCNVIKVSLCLLNSKTDL